MSTSIDNPSWGTIWSFNFRNDPKRLAFVLARYAFAAQMIGKKRALLEMGCGEGIGASVLKENVHSYTGVDYDSGQIETAQKLFSQEDYTFVCADFFEKQLGTFDAVVSLDVIEHIYQEHEERYVEAVSSHLCEKGIAVIGTPNVTTTPYASKLSREAHVNMFSQERLHALLSQFFGHVFCFGMNDEVVHTGYAPMSQYLICVACNPRREDGKARR